MFLPTTKYLVSSCIVFNLCFYFCLSSPRQLFESGSFSGGNISVSESQVHKKDSFLWMIETKPPSYFFGTIHVPYTRVWDAIPDNMKQAFATSQRVYFELDLTSQRTLSALRACQLLPEGKHISQVLPTTLYLRLKSHLNYIKSIMPSWITKDQLQKGLHADYLFSTLTANWERKQPIWIVLMLSSLTKSDIASKGYPVLDLHLSQLAERQRKLVGAIEHVEEQCMPLNKLNISQVIFALNHTLKQQEDIRWGLSKGPAFGIDELITHYRNGNLDEVYFNQDAVLFPSLSRATEIAQSESAKMSSERDRKMANDIDKYFREQMIFQRNQRMAERVIDLLLKQPKTSFFFAFGAGHFVGENTVLDIIRKAGLKIKHIAPDDKIQIYNPASSRNTVMGTFDDLSDEEKTRALLQFLQHHQQLEKENENKPFQDSVLNAGVCGKVNPLLKYYLSFLIVLSTFTSSILSKYLVHTHFKETGSNF